MLELATRPIETLHDVPVDFPLSDLPPSELSVQEQVPVRDERSARLAALAEAANPSYVRVFRPDPKAAMPEALFTGSKFAYWGLMLTCAAIMASVIISIAVVSFALTIGRVP